MSFYEKESRIADEKLAEEQKKETPQNKELKCKRQRKCTVDLWPDRLCEKCSDSLGMKTGS